ncbi:class I SAM-dependent methyltransferase [Zavarzinella formosa]|uniref:class I SAM-dependent methyltransferase n=1 Tax=Zavarzinella formosa TaxID=360055 RepID=UPI0002D63D04|nr:class I SAM-dependent methyltransferase [Zavarzinella formosa]
MTDQFSYVGTELELFGNARNWKAYWTSCLRPFVTGDVLEVGAGIGLTTKALATGKERSWTCLEPDATMAAEIATRTDLPLTPNIIVGTTDTLPPEPQYDAIAYIDVLEHIEDDHGEMARAAKLLRPGGHVVALSPAHQFLFSPFDKAIGHYRRYTCRTFADTAPPELIRRRVAYLDSLGMILSFGNRMVMGQSMPTPKQIAFWDGQVVPKSRWLDKLFAGRLGKSVIGVWQKTG